MVNKKGYIKTLEAVIAIIIIVIISYTLIAQPTETPPDVPSIVKGAQNIITQGIQFNETVRNLTTFKDVITDLDPADKETLLNSINNTISKNRPPGYDYTCLICYTPGTCYAHDPIPQDRNIYMMDILIASWEKQQNPKIVRIWFWKQPTQTTDPTHPADYAQQNVLNTCNIQTWE